MRNGIRQVRRIVIGVIGGTVVLIGVVLLVTPGPAFVVIPAGLAILGLEFAWARRWIRRVRKFADEQIAAAMSRGPSKDDPARVATSDNPESCPAGETDPVCHGPE